MPFDITQCDRIFHPIYDSGAAAQLLRHIRGRPKHKEASSLNSLSNSTTLFTESMQIRKRKRWLFTIVVYHSSIFLNYRYALYAQYSKPFFWYEIYSSSRCKVEPCWMLKYQNHHRSKQHQMEYRIVYWK